MMGEFLSFLSRVGLVLGLVVLVTAGAYFAGGGASARGLSDWLVYASFITLAVGLVFGFSLRAVQGATLSNPQDTPRQRYIREFFRAGPFAAAFTVAAVLCFFAAVLVDVLLSPK